MSVVVLLPVGITNVGFQAGQGFVAHDHELLVGGGVNEELKTPFRKALFQLFRHVDGVAADVKIQVIREQRVKLHADQAAFGHHGPVLLDVGDEALRRAVTGEHHGLPTKRPHLGAADIEGVAQGGNVGQGHVGFITRQPVAQPRPVQKQRDCILLAYLMQGFQLRLAVQRAVFRGMGNIHPAGINHVRIGGVGVEGLEIRFQFARVDLAVMGRQGQHLVAGVFDGSGFVHVDVARRSGNHALRAVEQPVDHHLVALCAANQKENIRLRVVDSGADFVLCPQGIFVLTVAHLLDKIRFDQGLQQLRMRAFGIVVFK